MEHYDIGETVHTSDPPEIPGQLPPAAAADANDSTGGGGGGCLVMRVKPNSKVGHLVDYAMTRFLGNDKDSSSSSSSSRVAQVLWTGDGDAFEKVVSCAEVSKRRATEQRAVLHQANCIYYQQMHQYYEPKMAGLDRLQAVREVPAIRCLLSVPELPPSANSLASDAEFARHFASTVLPAEAKRQRAAPASNPGQRHVTKVKAKRGARLLLAGSSRGGQQQAAASTACGGAGATA